MRVRKAWEAVQLERVYVKIIYGTMNRKMLTLDARTRT